MAGISATDQAGGPYTLTVSQGEEYVVLEDVLYGRVLPCRRSVQYGDGTVEL